MKRRLPAHPLIELILGQGVVQGKVGAFSWIEVLLWCALGSVLAAFGAPADAAGPLDAAIDTRVTTQKEAADSQERIDAVADRTHAILLDFQHVGTSCRSSWGRAMVNSLRRESRP